MRQIRNPYANICLVLVTFTACSKAVQYGINVPRQTEPVAVVSTSINASSEKLDWVDVIRKTGEKLAERVKEKTLSDEYKLHYAAYKGDTTQLAEWITTNFQWINKPMDGNITPLHLAVFQGNIESVRLLLGYGADARSLMNETNSYIQPIHIAAWSNALDVLRALISEQSAVIGDCDATGKTALHWAASQGHTHCVKELLQAGSDANSENQEGHTPLCFALEGNHFEVIAQLVNKGANVDCITYIHNIDRPLRGALQEKAYTCIAAMVRKGNVSVDLYSKDAEGQTLLDCALQTDHPLSIRHLLWKESGDNWINYIDQDGTPLLHHTILGNHPKLLEALLANSTLNVNAQDAAGKSALQLAVEQGLLTVVQQLLAVSGIDVNQKDNEGQTALYTAVAHERMKIAEVLMKLPAIEVLEGNEYNQTLLEAAFEKNYISFIKKLFDAEEDVNVKNDWSNTLLHTVAETGSSEILKSLLKIKGIDINAADIRGNTLLHLAAERGHTEVVKVLLERGANKNAKNKNGKTPLNLADANGHSSWTDVNGRTSIASILLRSRNLGSGSLFNDHGSSNLAFSWNEDTPPKRRKFQ